MKTLLTERDRIEIVDRISRLRRDSPRQWGRMSPHGMLCHLTDSFQACLGDRPSVDRSTPVSRSLVRFIAVTSPLRWPQEIKAIPEVDQEMGGTAPVEFEDDLKRLLEIIAEFVIRVDATQMRHPIFGRMSAKEWGRWGYRHIDHHARQFGLQVEGE